MDWTGPISYVLRSSTSGYSAGAGLSQIDALSFGMLVKTQGDAAGRETIYGLLYDIHIDDDPLVRQLVLADAVSEETIRDQRHHRIAPVEMNVLAIAFRDGAGQLRHALPPRPPISLMPVHLCSQPELHEVTSRFDYFRLVLGAPEVPGEQLLAASLLQAASMYPEREQFDFLVRAGREAARLLSSDMSRLDYLLRLLYPYITAET